MHTKFKSYHFKERTKFKNTTIYTYYEGE